MTGAFGNIGRSALEELLARRHQVTCFDIKTEVNEERANTYGDRVGVVWGDLRNRGEVAAAVQDQEVVIHLAFVIPRLSATGVESEERPELAREINVGGTSNLLAAMSSQPKPSRILFTSSLHVYGRTQEDPPPRTVSDPVRPVEHYARHKVECERRIVASNLVWTIFRLGAALPVRLILDPGMFDVPLNNRIEFVHSRDVGQAIANAIEREEVWGRTWLIGGGPRCQFYYRDLVEQILEVSGVGMLPEEAFNTVPYSTDWLDTEESQRVLDYQHRTLDDYVQDLRDLLGIRRPLIRLFRPFVRYWLLRQSPYYRQTRAVG